MAVRVNNIIEVCDNIRKESYENDFVSSHQINVIDYLEMMLYIFQLEDKTISNKQLEYIIKNIKKLFNEWTNEILERIKNEL